MNTLPRPKPLLLVILDGWGLSAEEEGNAIMLADTPVIDQLASHYPAAAVVASGLEVGLPIGQGGNSETGHRNIGAGRVEYQILASIDRAIADKSFFENPVLKGAFDHAKKNNSNLHLMGLASRGGVHAHLDHLFSIMQMAAAEEWRENIYIHMFTDGRDTPPQSALGYLASIEEAIGKYGLGQVASVTGRFYAMDRNSNWDRTQATYDMLTGGERGLGASSAKQAIDRSYEEKVFDEMIPPTAITTGGAAVVEVQDGDALIFFNFRPDRSRQLTQAFVNPDEVGFKAKRFKNLYFATLAQHDPDVSSQSAFREEVADWPLARVLSEAGLKQLHIAETEKYAHVTYYINVGQERPFEGEERVVIRSSSIRNFADDPAMEAEAITNRVVAEIKQGDFDFYLINYANPDMVGHTGNLEAAAQACEWVDKSLGKLQTTALSKGGALVVTSDHGNVEGMIELGDHKLKTDHTSNPVPFYYVRRELTRTPKSGEEVANINGSPAGVLADIAPTVLDILRLEKPGAMTGVSLLGSLR